jgi:DNA-binding CsgD family transcriptional regulator
MLEFILGLLGNLLATELGAWAPNLADKIIAHTARRVPPPHDQRLLEEWRALLADTPGDLGKLMLAVSLYWSREDLREECEDDAISRHVSMPEVTGLSPREMTILHWVKEGKTNWEIGLILGISHRTVQFHLESIKMKLHTTSRTQTVARYLESSVHNDLSLNSAALPHPQSTLRQFILFLMKHGY